MRRKRSIELAGRRATLAETDEWIELLRLYVRDMLSFEIDARGDGTHTMQQSARLKAEPMRASDKMDSCNTRAALQILQTNARAPQNRQAAAEVHSLVAVDASDREKLNIKMQCAAVKQAATKFAPSPAKLVKEWPGELCSRPNQGPVDGGMQTFRQLEGLRVDQLCYVSGLAPGPGLWSRTAQPNCGQRPRLPRWTVVPRNQNLDNRCSSPVLENCDRLHWQRY